MKILVIDADYYKSIRTHRSLDKDAPVSRPVPQTGIISSHAILGGLHHHYDPGESAEELLNFNVSVSMTSIAEFERSER
jgi:hypothetical protein